MSAPVRLLLVEDDEAIIEVLTLGLRYEGFEVDVARDGSEALRSHRSRLYDLIMLDLMLPELDGLSVLSRIRQTSDVPVIVITARDAVEDRVLGLQEGADDYVTKPFEFPELIARVNAVLRRQGTRDNGDRIEVFDLVIEQSSRRVWRQGHPISLTRRQFDLLVTLASHPERVISKHQLYEAAWGWDYLGNANVVEQQISQLRRALDQFGPPLIHTMRGIGYVLRLGET